MAQRSLSRRLSAQDAAFLYFEKPESPMHIGSIAVFEGDVPFDRFVDNIASKLHLIPRYRQRVVPAPFNLGHPTWEFDPEFDIARHIQRLRIDPPGSHAQLIELAARLFQGMLGRDKPLWEMYLVEGLEGSRSASISKVHHCLVDGVSGIELLMVVLDLSPNPPPPPPALEPYRPPPIPAAPSRLFDAFWDNLADGLDVWAGFQRGLTDLALGAATERSRAVMRALETALPYFAVPVTRAPFNKGFSGERQVACSEISFQEVRAIRAACGGTVNDVVLAVLGGALGRYLEMHGETIDGRIMRVLTPVNVRREDERAALGNRVSMLLVELPVGLRDPVERLRAITARTEALKRAQVADGLELAAELLGAGPPAAQALLGMLPTPRNTVANLVCTNVPGPMIPLYTVGHRMVAHYPLIPIAWEMGIGCGVTSYDQKLYFGLMADVGAAADVARLKEFLDQAYVELRAAAGVAKTDLPQMGAAPVVKKTRRRGAAPVPGQAIAADAS
ncbi:MAG TPA: wax ester/triacylglycerol synthase family O-acyltransferase [Dehalococcoidia bacterium]|nr:wax ester/triacylglycerol synthase family O-acyltransferase [Dehalococcoidia bacterium]